MQTFSKIFWMSSRSQGTFLKDSYKCFAVAPTRQKDASCVKSQPVSARFDKMAQVMLSTMYSTWILPKDTHLSLSSLTSYLCQKTYWKRFRSEISSPLQNVKQLLYSKVKQWDAVQWFAGETAKADSKAINKALTRAWQGFQVCNTIEVLCDFQRLNFGREWCCWHSNIMSFYIFPPKWKRHQCREISGMYFIIIFVYTQYSWGSF